MTRSDPVAPEKCSNGEDGEEEHHTPKQPHLPALVTTG